jgi:hypothetical protein
MISFDYQYEKAGNSYEDKMTRLCGGILLEENQLKEVLNLLEKFSIDNSKVNDDKRKHS